MDQILSGCKGSQFIELNYLHLEENLANVSIPGKHQSIKTSQKHTHRAAKWGRAGLAKRASITAKNT